jgi:hyperosmotically inducible periplasmic protein
MKLSYKVMCGVTAVLLSSAVFAQDASAPSAGEPMTKAQIRAERKAERPENKALSKRVQQAIYKTKGLEDAEIAVFATAKTGNVILAGMIIDPAQEQMATDAASKVPGVKSVTSKLTMYEEGAH